MIDGSACLDFSQDCQEFRRGNLAYGPVAEVWEDIAFQALQHIIGVAFRPDGFFVGVLLPRHGLKAGLSTPRFDLFLRGRGNTLTEHFSGLCALFSRFRQRELGVYAKGEQFFPALKTVLHAPAFRTFWGYEEEKAVAVKEFLGFVCGRCAVYGGIGGGRMEVSPPLRKSISPYLPPNQERNSQTRIAEFEQSFSEIPLIIKVFRTVLNSATMKSGAGNGT